MKSKCAITAGLSLLFACSLTTQGCRPSRGEAASVSGGASSAEAASVPGQKRNTRTQFYIDVSASMFDVTDDVTKSRPPKRYMKALLSTIDTIEPNTYIEIRTFTNEPHSMGLRKVYDGSPSGREDVFRVLKRQVFPDKYTELLRAVNPDDKHLQPGGPKEPAAGTSFQGVLEQIEMSCLKNPSEPIRAVIVTDGGICGDENSGAKGDEHEIMAATRKVTEIAKKCRNFAGILILPVANQTNLRQILEQKIFRDFGDKALVASDTEVQEKTDAFAAL